MDLQHVAYGLRALGYDGGNVGADLEGVEVTSPNAILVLASITKSNTVNPMQLNPP